MRIVTVGPSSLVRNLSIPSIAASSDRQVDTEKGKPRRLRPIRKASYAPVCRRDTSPGRFCESAQKPSRVFHMNPATDSPHNGVRKPPQKNSLESPSCRSFLPHNQDQYADDLGQSIGLNTQKNPRDSCRPSANLADVPRKLLTPLQLQRVSVIMSECWSV